MSDTVIRVEGLGKRYRYGGAEPLGDTLRGDIVKWVKGLVNGRKPVHPVVPVPSPAKAAADSPYFWALNDVNFEVAQGDVVGIIGRNGAGKSTLLKILSRITPPTHGTIALHGRVASLLEVGTGFHRELTGRENVFLNGSILGMRRADIAKRFDEIVAFAEVEKFIDTPVKFYSSGMYVRLAFGVAAHLEPEILIIDEVLAVGDAGFQRKCLGKMKDVSQAGRTVLFVSHNMAAIKTLCSRGILLEGGRVTLNGTSEEAVSRYLNASTATIGNVLADRTDRSGNGRLRFTGVTFLDRQGLPLQETTSGDPLAIRIDYETKGAIDHQRMILAFALWDEMENRVALFASDEMGITFKPFGERGRVHIQIPQLLLRGGAYTLGLMASHATTAPENFYDGVQHAASLIVHPGDYWKSGCTNRPGAYSVQPATMSNDALA